MLLKELKTTAEGQLWAKMCKAIRRLGLKASEVKRDFRNN